MLWQKLITFPSPCWQWTSAAGQLCMYGQRQAVILVLKPTWAAGAGKIRSRSCFERVALMSVLIWSFVDLMVPPDFLSEYYLCRLRHQQTWYESKSPWPELYPSMPGRSRPSTSQCCWRRTPHTLNTVRITPLTMWIPSLPRILISSRARALALDGSSPPLPPVSL